MTAIPAAPPQNVEAEKRVLGTLLVFYKPELVTLTIGAGVKFNDFSVASHRVIYRAVLRMHFDHEWVEAGTVARFLSCQRNESAGTFLDAIGGRATLEELECHASANGFREYVRMVAEDGRWRRWLRTMLEALESIHARDEDSFWAALARVREDVLPSELHVVEGGKEKAA